MSILYTSVNLFNLRSCRTHHCYVSDIDVQDAFKLIHPERKYVCCTRFTVFHLELLGT